MTVTYSCQVGGAKQTEGRVFLLLFFCETAVKKVQVLSLSVHCKDWKRTDQLGVDVTLFQSEYLDALSM